MSKPWELSAGVLGCCSNPPGKSQRLSLLTLISTVITPFRYTVPQSFHTRKMNPDHHSGLCDCTNVSNDRQRRLVVAFDGTQNEFGTQVRENLMMLPLRMWIITLQHQSSHVVEFYSRIAKTSDQLSYYTSGIGTFVPTSSRARRPRMWIKNKWASMVGR